MNDNFYQFTRRVPAFSIEGGFRFQTAEFTKLYIRRAYTPEMPEGYRVVSEERAREEIGKALIDFLMKHKNQVIEVRASEVTTGDVLRYSEIEFVDIQIEVKRWITKKP